MVVDPAQLRSQVLVELRKAFPSSEHSHLDRLLATFEQRLLAGALEQVQRVPFVGDMIMAAMAKIYAQGCADGFSRGDAVGYQRGVQERARLAGRRR
jgi:hypothetical protein